MTGEELTWFLLALRLGHPVQWVRDRTTSSEFTIWKYILAAEEEHRLLMENGGKVHLFELIKKYFYRAKSSQPKDPRIDTRVLESKAYWLGGLGKQPIIQQEGP